MSEEWKPVSFPEYSDYCLISKITNILNDRTPQRKEFFASWLEVANHDTK